METASELARQASQGVRLRQLQAKQANRLNSAGDNVVSGAFIGYSTDNTPLARLQNGAVVPISATSSGGSVQDERVPFVRNGGELFGVWRSR